MNMDALMNAKEMAFNLQNKIFLYKQELTVCGAIMSDSVCENLFNKIEEMEGQYLQVCTLISHYEKELGF